MTVYLVERDLPGVTMEQLAAAQRAAIETSQRFSEAGREVRYLRSVFVPDDSRCMCLFEAESAALTREVNDSALIPYTRVTPALDLRP